MMLRKGGGGGGGEAEPVISNRLTMLDRRCLLSSQSYYMAVK